MGIRHLIKTRETLKDNPTKSFSFNELRKIVGQNVPQVMENIDYLNQQEGVVKRVPDEFGNTKLQWRKK